MAGRPPHLHEEEGTHDDTETRDPDRTGDTAAIDTALASDSATSESGTTDAIAAAATENGTTHGAASDYDYDASDAVEVVLSDSGSSRTHPASPGAQAEVAAVTGLL